MELLDHDPQEQRPSKWGVPFFFEAVLDPLTIGDQCSDFENRKTHEWKRVKMSAKAHRSNCVPERPTVNHGCQIPNREAPEIGKRTSERAGTPE